MNRASTITFADRFAADILMLRKTETRRAVDEIIYPYVEPHLGLRALGYARVVTEEDPDND